MLYVLTIAMQKGGVAKTTTAAVLAQAAQHKGQRVLALDLDPQANLTFALGADGRQPGSFELIEGRLPAANLVQHCGGVDVIPASRALATLKTEKGSALRLRKALQPVAANYDFVVIDTPTLEGELLYNALCASNGLLIPTEADIYNLQDIYQLKQTAERMQAANAQLQILGYVLTRIDTRTTLAKQMQDNLQKTGLQCLGYVRTGVAVKEAAALQANLYDYEPNSKPAADYMTLYERITERGQ